MTYTDIPKLHVKGQRKKRGF